MNRQSQHRETTGLFINEALHLYKVLTAAGFKVDLTSKIGSNFRKKLDNIPKAANLDGSKYGANGGIMSFVCHGPTIFAGVVDLSINKPLIKGKEITGFTIELAAQLGAKYSRSFSIWDNYHNPASTASTTRAMVEAFKKL
ncbi:class I glutamine amidotransferase-like protein [Diplogelasinospora grovesii]|uniref:Class I glutamine amidotransferase-like protein n=1 Tax=Diplogelasinospora grovesii TaxID=303347 RepID=A0AAN6MW28_9PEZI|nr:class I glutamine amidotransferase-like protein [Diplogelasinospora grovesii]